MEQARQEIGQYIDRYQRRLHSGLGYRTPLEGAWRPVPHVLHATAT